MAIHGNARGVAMAAIVLLAVTGLAGCAGQQGTSGQAGVSNTSGSFSYGGQAAGKSGTETYDWDNPSSRAQVNWGGQASSGSMTVTIHDASGTEVFSRTFSGTGQGGASSTTSSGTSGQWRITIQFSSFTGQMGLNVNAS